MPRKNVFAAVLVLLFAAIVPSGLEAQPAKQAAVVSPAAKRALLDQYCVTCHNDKLKNANLSLQSADINAVGDHPERWEQVIRKLRAGMMPPRRRTGARGGSRRLDGQPS